MPPACGPGLARRDRAEWLGGGTAQGSPGPTWCRPTASRLAPEPAYAEPRDPEWAYLVTGFSECIDSFFAFGLFELAQAVGLFPPELVDTFEPVIQEEARHILLFANWLAWHRRRLPLWRRPWFELRVAAVWAFLVWERIGIARGVSGGNDKAPDNNFTLNGSKAVSDVDISSRR